jgi:hypothetical protein
MLNAYVGIVTTHGLKAIHVERMETIRRVRQSAAITSRFVGFWAVLPESEAQVIQFLLGEGEQDSALHYLSQTAREIGRILPLNHCQ